MKFSYSYFYQFFLPFLQVSQAVHALQENLVSLVFQVYQAYPEGRQVQEVLLFQILQDVLFHQARRVVATARWLPEAVKALSRYVSKHNADCPGYRTECSPIFSEC